MADNARVSRDAVRSAARLANLDLPEGRLDQLVTTLSSYLEHLDRLREIDIRDSEPPAITFESEGRS